MTNDRIRIFRAPVFNDVQLQKFVRDARKRRRMIITTNGVFDIVHAGHIAMFDRCRAFGGVVIVGVNSDTSVRKNKGKFRPIIPQRYRLNLLSSLRQIDALYIITEETPIQFLTIVRPDIHVNSAEYGRDCIEANALRAHGGRQVFVAKNKVLLSTSKIIAKLQKGVLGR